MGFDTFQLEHDMVSAALAEGLRHIDTSQAYENEEQVGAGLRRADVRRDDVFLTTKMPIADTIGALNDLIAAGKVRHGACRISPWIWSTKHRLR